MASEREVLRVAVHLADRLADWKSLAFYRKVARLVPEPVIYDALRAALDIPPSEVERSRGAYFAAVVRPYLDTARAKSKLATLADAKSKIGSL